MSDLQRALNEYLAIRRTLGFTLRLPARLLRRFVAFVDQAGSAFVTTDLALRWATQPETAQPSTWTWRLGIVRRFAAWHRAIDPRTEVPPAGLLAHRYRRKPPYGYQDDEVIRIVRAAGALPSARGLRGHTYATLFGLLAATGLRLSEGLALDRDDVDFAQSLLVIRHTKFGKSRLVPVHSSTRDALRRYAAARDRSVHRPATPAFFLSERGTRITEWTARYTFAVVSRTVGLRAPAGGSRHGRGPRLHDLRHRFAARTLIDWYRAGRDVEREIPKLATYLGHAHVTDTYWYLEAVPELLQLAADRLRPPEPAP
jgi:integrase/recombinase XerD